MTIEFKMITTYAAIVGDEVTVMEEDLKLCTVRPMPNDFDRRFCFEILSPTKYAKSCMIIFV